MAASRRGDGDSPPASALKPPNCKCYTADSMGGETRLNKMATGKTQIPPEGSERHFIGCAYTGGSLTAWLHHWPGALTLGQYLTTSTGLSALRTRKQRQLSPTVAMSFKWSNLHTAWGTEAGFRGHHTESETLHPGTRLLCLREPEQTRQQIKEQDAWREGRKTFGRFLAEKAQDYLLALVLLFI